MKPESLFPNLKAWQEVKLTDHLDLFKKGKKCDWLNELANIYDANIYGGFLEDRSPLFDLRHEISLPIHVGVDFWVDEGTPVFCDFWSVPSKALYYGESGNCRGGWGYRVDVLKNNLVYIFGHLSPKRKKENPILEKGTSLDDYFRYLPFKNFRNYYPDHDNFIGRIGSRQENGGWRPHLHLQVVDYKFYKTFKNPRDIDAYMPNDPEILRHFHNPLDL